MIIEGRKRFGTQEIESKAIQLLQHYKGDYFQYIRCTPLLSITEFLKNKYSIVFNFDAILGFSENSQRILGAFNPKKRVILIDSSLKADEHKFNFTLAHEIGHLALHRNVTIKADKDDEEGNNKDETISDTVFGNKTLKTESDWMEWQANYYASCLLMPNEILKAALIMKQKELGISRVGKIYVDEQPCNVSDFYKIILLLSEFFKVSKSAIEYRLYKLNLVDDKRRMKSIYQILNIGS